MCAEDGTGPLKPANKLSRATDTWSRLGLGKAAAGAESGLRQGPCEEDAALVALVAFLKLSLCSLFVQESQLPGEACEHGRLIQSACVRVRVRVCLCVCGVCVCVHTCVCM